MERTPEQRSKELAQVWHYLDHFPFPRDMASMCSAWVLQEAFPLDTDRRHKLITAGMEMMGHDSEIRVTRDILKVIEAEAVEREKLGLKEEAHALRFVAKRIIEGEPIPQVA